MQHLQKNSQVELGQVVPVPQAVLKRSHVLSYRLSVDRVLTQHLAVLSNGSGIIHCCNERAYFHRISHCTRPSLRTKPLTEWA